MGFLHWLGWNRRHARTTSRRLARAVERSGRPRNASTHIEGLEPRSVPAVLVGLGDAATLITFDSATPGTISQTIAVTGLQQGESLVGIDFRPADRQLFAVGDTNALYTIDLSSGLATQVGHTSNGHHLAGSQFGADFDLVGNRLRVVGDADQNFRMHPQAGVITGNGTRLAYAGGDPHFGADPNVVAIAYDRNTAGQNTAALASTALFGIDSNLDVLVRQGGIPGGNPGGPSPNSGKLFTIGPLGLDVTDVAGFDIAGDGTAFAALAVSGGTSSGLYTIDLTTGAATFVGTIGGGELVSSLSVMPTGFAFSAPVYHTAESAPSADISVLRFGPAIGTVSVQYAAQNGSATDPGDFDATAGTLTFGPGETVKTFTVVLHDDTLLEGNEAVRLILSSPSSGMELGEPSAARLVIHDDDGTATERFVAQIYLDALGRPVDAGGLAFWRARLENGTPRADVAAGILASDEYRAALVQSLYVSVLGRPADAQGSAFWSHQMAGGLTVAQVRAALMGSPEYWHTRGHGSADEFLENVYHDALGRDVDDGGLAYFQALVNAGVSPHAVAAAIIASHEAHDRVVDHLYEQYLGREADDGGRDFLVQRLLASGRREDILAAMIGSDEYFGNL